MKSGKDEWIFSKTEYIAGFDFLSNNPANFFNDSKLTTSFLISNDREAAEGSVYEEFDSWVKSYTAKTASRMQIDARQIDAGEQLAIRRREQLKQLIQSDPQAALAKAIPVETLALLPSSIAEHAEQHISATGDFMVYEACAINPAAASAADGSKQRVRTATASSRTEREVVIGADRYTAYVYGRRQAMTTKLAIPLSGIAIDGEMAVDEAPVRIIEGGGAAAAEVGGETKYFADKAALDDFVAEQINWEAEIGPERAAAASGGKAVGGRAAEAAASSWTTGAKTVLVIRVDFSDRPGEPVDTSNQTFTVANAQSLFNNQINPFYVANSYNQTSLTATVIPTVVRMPQPQSYYTQGTNYNAMMTDARTAATQAGYDPNNYSLEVVTFSYTSGFSWAGLATIGGRGNLINGSFVLPVVAHELGHNYGLLHANLWRTTDGTIIGQGSNIEYGDCYDVMGSCYGMGANAHFNAHYKRNLDWLTDANVQTVTSDGIYRIYAQDSSTNNSGIRALKINKDSTKNYWVEFRQLFTSIPSAMSGALIRWDYASKSYQETELLDMIPTTSTLNDAPLPIGATPFYDSDSHIKITVIGKGGTTPESLDVKVEFNQSGNSTPTPTATATPTATPTATATPTITPTATPSCAYSITPGSQGFGSAGGTGSISVSSQSGCSWTATTSQSFVSISSGSNGISNGYVYYSVAPNTGSTARSATITIGGQIFTVQQSGTTSSSYTLIASPSVVALGGQVKVSWTAPSGSSTLDWIGLYQAGAPNNYYYLGYMATNGVTSGSFTTNLVDANGQPLPAGQYEFRYLLNNTYSSVIASNTVTVQSTVSTPTPTATPTATPISTATPTPTVITTPTPSNRTNVALATNGATASSSSDYSAGYSPGGAINGDRKGLNWSNGGLWNDGTPDTYPDWLQVDFAASRTIDEIDVFTLQDNYTNPIEPTQSTTFNSRGITSFDVQYWNGSAWVTVPNGSITNNNKVWSKLSFSAVTTTKIRVVVNSALADYSRITELEAWSSDVIPPPPTPTPTPSNRTNVALATNGATASSSSDYSAGYSPGGAINGDRKGLNWSNGGLWNDGTPDTYPDWLQVDFAASRTIDEIDVFTLQDNYTNPIEPTQSTTFNSRGITSFDVQYWNGSAWVTVPNGSITNNNKVWSKLSFSAVTTTKIRVVVNSALADYSRITELEAWSNSN